MVAALPTPAQIPVLAVLPVTPAPEGGYPVVVFAHGITRSKKDALAIAPQLAKLGSAFDHVQVRDRDMADCCRAGIWLYHDFLDEAHNICQEIHTPSGRNTRQTSGSQPAAVITVPPAKPRPMHSRAASSAPAGPCVTTSVR